MPSEAHVPNVSRIGGSARAWRRSSGALRSRAGRDTTPHALVAAATFALELAKLDEYKVVFGNVKNDFPRRITYHRASGERLVITLDDPQGMSDRVQRFDLKRVPH